jgi:sialic acid synthase SpsE
MKSFKIGGRIISDDTPTIFFPDIGTFFNQNMDIAKNLIMCLHKEGAPLIKGEILHDESIALDDDTYETYLGIDGQIKKERNRNLIKRKVVSFSAYEKLFTYCKSLEMGFVLSVYDNKGAEFAREIGAEALKIASSNIFLLC